MAFQTEGAPDSMRKLTYFWSIKACKPIVVVTQTKIMDLKISITCLLHLPCNCLFSHVDTKREIR